MERSNLDFLVLQLPENVCYVSDYWPLLGLTFVVLPLDGEPTLLHNNFETDAESWIRDVRRFSAESPHTVEDPIGNAAEALAELIPRGKKRIGYEGSFSSMEAGYLRYRANAVTGAVLSRLRKAAGDHDWADATDMIYESRVKKTPKEVVKLKLANRVSAVGLRVLYEGIKDGRTEAELSAEIERATVVEGVQSLGAKHVVACSFLSSGEFTADTFGVCYGNRPRKMRRGDLVMVEFDVAVDGYTSDMSRTYTVGTPRGREKHLLESVYAAQVEGVELERGGVRARDVSRLADHILARQGYGRHIRHYFGHGLGVAIWEPSPYLHSKSDDILEVGMVHSAEPGVYIPHFGGARIEDNIFLGKSGPEYLSTFMPIQE